MRLCHRTGLFRSHVSLERRERRIPSWFTAFISLRPSSPPVSNLTEESSCDPKKRKKVLLQILFFVRESSGKQM